MDGVGLVFLLGIWVLVIVASVKMADRRGRDTFWWGVGGFMFGIFAILVLWALGDTREVQDEKLGRVSRVEEEDEREPCPECREPIVRHARVCRFCGARFDLTVVPGHESGGAS